MPDPLVSHLRAAIAESLAYPLTGNPFVDDAQLVMRVRALVARQDVPLVPFGGMIYRINSEVAA